MRPRSFFSGFLFFSTALIRILTNPSLRKWYARTFLKTLGGAFFFLLCLLGAGIWAFSKGIANPWMSGVTTIFWVILLIYLSGLITSIFMNLLGSTLSDEQGLLNSFEAGSFVVLKPARWRDRRILWQRSLLTLGVSILAWPLLLFPLSLPLGMVIFAWVMGQEQLYATQRLLHQNNEVTLLDKQSETPHALAVGLAFVPCILSAVPLVGWALLPVVKVASILALRNELVPVAQNPVP